MPVGQRQRVFSFRQGQGPEQKVTLRYGNGPSTISIGKHQFAFALSPAEGGAFDLTIDGVKSKVTAVIPRARIASAKAVMNGLRWPAPAPCARTSVGACGSAAA